MNNKFITMSEALEQDVQDKSNDKVQPEAQAPESLPDIIVNLGLLNELISIAAEKVSYKELVPVIVALEKNIRLAEAPVAETPVEGK